MAKPSVAKPKPPGGAKKRDRDAGKSNGRATKAATPLPKAPSPKRACKPTPAPTAVADDDAVLPGDSDGADVNAALPTKPRTAVSSKPVAGAGAEGRAPASASPPFWPPAWPWVPVFNDAANEMAARTGASTPVPGESGNKTAMVIRDNVAKFEDFAALIGAMGGSVDELVRRCEAFKVGMGADVVRLLIAAFKLVQSTSDVMGGICDVPDDLKARVARASGVAPLDSAALEAFIGDAGDGDVVVPTDPIPFQDLQGDPVVKPLAHFILRCGFTLIVEG